MDCYIVSKYYYGKDIYERTLEIIGVYNTLKKAKKVFKKHVEKYTSESYEKQLDDERFYEKWNGKKLMFDLGNTRMAWCCTVELKKIKCSL